MHISNNSVQMETLYLFLIQQQPSAELKILVSRLRQAYLDFPSSIYSTMHGLKVGGYGRSIVYFMVKP